MTTWTTRSSLTKGTLAAATLATAALVAPSALAAPIGQTIPTPLAGHHTVGGPQAPAVPHAPAMPPAQVAKAAAAEKRAAIQATLDAAVADGAVGIAARVDSPTYSDSFAAGKRALNENPPANPITQFRVASNTKPMVATAVLQQVQQGRWTLDTTIGDVLPGLVPGRDAVTIEQLLSHRSGMPDGLLALIGSRMQDPTSNAEFFEVLGQDYSDQEIIDTSNALPWVFEPDTDYLYSNAGYVVLGMMLEAATGRSMADILKFDVFKPAGMNQTEFKDAAGMRGNGLEDAGFVEGQGYSLANFNPEIFSSAGAVVSTTKDLNAFTDALLDGRLVNQALLAEMMTIRSTKGIDYGLGLYRLPDPCGPAPDSGAEPTYLYGHDGPSFGALSMALSSHDGTRQYSVGANGRHYDDPTGLQPYDLGAVIYEMAAATC